ncbi:MAG: DNA alkylation repair protein [Alphaproteobacteria bacterium]|nr:MAG: DNA alkylation repair protein [Alphaproteobacteria bacterium]
MYNSYESIKQILLHSIDSSPKAASRFFKTGPGEYSECDQFLGIKMPTLRLIAKKCANLSLEILTNLLHSVFNEERLLALITLVAQYQKANPIKKEEIYHFYLKNVRHINNWNLVDSSAHHILGSHLWGSERKILVNLAKSKNLWERRIAIISTLYFVKRQDFEYTIKLSEILLDDKHDLIHKASGWMLRETGKQNPAVLIAFLEQYCKNMPRTMLRYAIEKLPENIRKRYLTMK